MFRLPQKRLVLCFPLLTSLLLALSEKPSVIPLLPAGDWRQVGTQTMGVEAVRQYGGDPRIEREYGVQSLEHRTYQWNNAVAEVIVEQAPDPSTAYGLLTCYRTEPMAPEEGMHLTLKGPEGALMTRGRSFIRVLSPIGPQLDASEFRSLLTRVGGTPPSSDAVANLPAALPAVGLIPGTEKYLVGLEAARHVLPSFRTDLIGFVQGAEVQMAAYAGGKKRVTVLSVAYPTPQIARRQFGLMKNLLGVNQANDTQPIRGRRLGSFVFLVLNADSALVANKLLDDFKVSNSVSWDRPYPGAKPFTLQMMELILANVVFVTMVVGLAIGGGLSIVLFRRTMAKLFPDSAWGRPDEGTIIRLGLS